ncbi:MAG: hypothetical protein A3H39_21070 [candidate division NC10 bacterium RIFCSPLOWO2_02_FULL_66_22]|nr:MAG: hypothetical protein A3H39_21070 [candidate division NC10 bacterium RIFCSPLOWO2_02_FULL_66_22]
MRFSLASQGHLEGRTARHAPLDAPGTGRHIIALRVLAWQDHGSPRQHVAGRRHLALRHFETVRQAGK